MRQEQLAQDNLRAFSQNTHYIFDWKQRESPQVPQKPQQRYSITRMSMPAKQQIPKLTPKQQANKQNALCRFEYPIVEENDQMLRKASKKVMKCQGILKLAELKKQKQKRSKLINRLVEDEFAKVTQQVFESLTKKSQKKNRPPPRVLKSNSLPYISNLKPSIQVQQRFSKPSAAILIDNFETPESQGSHRRSISQGRLQK